MLQNCLLSQNSSPLLNPISPSESEIIECMGSPLAEIFMQYIHPEKQRLICSSRNYNESQFQEFQESSYSQLIRNKAHMKPPPNDQRVKSFTHEGILILGQRVLKKFEQIQNLKRTDESKQNEMETRYLFAAEKRRALELQEEKLRLEHEKCYTDLLLQLKSKLEDDLKKAKQEHNKELTNCLIKERLDVMHEMMQKMSDEMSDIIVSLCKNFHENLINERSHFIKVFNYCLSVERDMAKEQMRQLEMKRIKDLFCQKQELEVQNLTNLTHILCLEKMRYNEKKQELKRCYQKRIEIVQQLLASVLQLCTKRTESKKSVVKEEDVQFYQSKILEIVKQYKKLINFTFDEIPGQADFLFNVDIFLSLTNRLESEKLRLPVEETTLLKVTEIITDKEGNKWEPVQSILENINEIDVLKCDFENNVYKCSSDPNETKTILQLLENNGKFDVHLK